jgi:homospermidine synthase
MNLRRMISPNGEKGPTAVLEHGANPGLISHFTKQGLIDIGRRAHQGQEGQGGRRGDPRLIADKKFNHLAQKLGVKVIHCSERDTQITDRPKQVDEFVNTWSVEGFREEGTTTAEMGWGTHEKKLPPLAYEHKDGPATRSASRAWASTPGSAPGCRTIASTAWSCATARRSRSPTS